MVLLEVMGHRIADGIAPDQYYTHLFSALLKFNLLLGLKVFYLQADNKTPNRNSIFCFLVGGGENLSHCCSITDRDLKLLQLYGVLLEERPVIRFLEHGQESTSSHEIRGNNIFQSAVIDNFDGIKKYPAQSH